LTLLSEKGIIFHGFSQTYLVKFHGIATFKPQYKFMKQEHFGYFGIWCDHMTFRSSFQPELFSVELYRFLYIKLFPPCTPLILEVKASNMENYRGDW